MRASNDFDSGSRSQLVGYLFGHPAAKEGGASAARKGRLGQSFNPETRSSRVSTAGHGSRLGQGCLALVVRHAYGSPWFRPGKRVIPRRSLSPIWQDTTTPATSVPLWKAIDTDHALPCGTGGYSIMRHNEIRDFTASLLGEVCGDVQIEPTLIPLSGEAQLGKSANTSSEARLDVSSRGFWGDRFARTMFDVRIFHPNAPSVRTVPVNSLYVRHEKEKTRRYEQRVKDVEGATFVPLVFSTAGGMGRSSSVTFKRIAALLAEKTGLSYAATINVVRCRLSFALLRSAITALRGSRRRAPTSTSFQPALALLLLRQECHTDH